MITITPISALKDNYIWAMTHTQTRQAVVVDPGEAAPVLAFLQHQQLKLAGILITHHHWDHTNGLAELTQIDVPCFGPAREKIAALTNPVQQGDAAAIPGFPDLTVFDIPGHTLGHVAYYAPGMLFSGDTLFTGGCGRYFEGTAEQLYQSLQTLAALPPATQVYCGHEYTVNNLRFAEQVEPKNKAVTARLAAAHALRAEHLPTVPASLQEEHDTNPFLRCVVPEVIGSVSHYAGKTLHNAVEVFTYLRKWKDEFVVG